METDNGTGDFVDYTQADLINRSVWRKEEIKESDADLDGDNDDVKGEISDPKDDIPLAAQ